MQAQEVSAPAEKAQRVEITGSNIKRTDKEGTSPIQSITAKEIRESGAATVADLLKKVPALGGGNALDSLDGSFSRGIATASLRGLGSSSTLILLNGRRMSPAAYANPNNGQSTLYDLNSIPVSALERVDIFKDGASAVYGSDAIAGVINFITKQDFEGAQISGSGSANGNGKFGRQKANVFAGIGNFANDGYNVFGTIDYSHRDRTALQDARGWERAQYQDINALLGPYYSAVSSSPIFFKEKSPGTASFVTSGAYPNPSIVNKLNCDPSQQLVGGPQYNMTASNYLTGRTFCNYNGNPFLEAQGAAEDISLLSRGQFRINADTSAFAEFAYTQSERKYTGVSRTIDGRSITTTFPQIGAGNSFQAILPVGHPDNPFPDARAALLYRFENIPGGSKNVNDATRALAGVKGSNFNWDWETAVLYNRVKREETMFGFIQLDAVQKLITQNRTIAQVAADPGISRPLVNRNSAEIAQWDGKASTEFGKLGGGAIGFATGLELRKEKMQLTPDPTSASGNILGLANQFVSGERNVSSAFVELRTPFAKNFEMDFAGRYDKYPNLKGSFTPKVGAKWTPSDTFALRGTYAEGFRAPALNQVTKGGTQYFLNGLSDPIRCPNGVNAAPGADQLDCSKSISGVAISNPQLKPETSKSMTVGMILSPTKDFDIAVDVYKIRKESEVALLDSNTVLHNPAKFPGLVLRDPNQANWLKDANGNVIPDSGPLFSIFTPYVNQGSTETTGIDFDATMRNSLGVMGNLSTKLNINYVMSYRSAANPGDAEFNVVGSVAGIANYTLPNTPMPRIKASLSSTWTTGPHATTATMNFVDAVSLLRRYDGTQEYATPYCQYGVGQPKSAYGLGGLPKYSNYYPDCKIPSWTTVDANYTYTGIKNLTLSLNIQNLFDAKA
ncbi:TonB-dependent receptor plug domain-containing protein, partial [Undibacterium sp.]|uniref:TonB-dependent receptor plug domain-containing protein n=1 Tax=Undibacterium sp. TaxID=1914977 RepID=UPI002CCD20C7